MRDKDPTQPLAAQNSLPSRHRGALKTEDSGVVWNLVRAITYFAVVLYLLGAGAAIAETIGHSFKLERYNPESCKSDAKGKAYIAIGAAVFAVPTVGDVLVNPVPAQDRRQPPDATEVEGCPRNPAQMIGYVFLNGIEVRSSMAGSTTTTPTWHPQLISIGVARPPTTVGHDLDERIRNATCAEAKIRETLANGLNACRVELKILKPNGQPYPIEDWGASYTSDPAKFATPLGNPLIVNCGPLLREDRISECQVMYALSNDLDLQYRFQPFIGPGAVAIADIIEFDRSLRAQLFGWLVHDYAWPATTSAPQKSGDAQ